MKSGQASWTAEVAAAARARHLLHIDGPIVVDDPYAQCLTSPTWRRILRSRILDWIVFENVLRSSRAVGAQVLGRARYAEDKLNAAVRAGVVQYVMVGAGFDSFALRRRDLEGTVAVFELDHPSTQKLKRARLRELAPDLPTNLEFVAIDFERQAIHDALGQSSFDRRRPAFFSWLGTTYYLTKDATVTTLGSLASCAAAGSELVFDYLVPPELITDSEVRLVRKIERLTARRGEPLAGRCRFSPDELATMSRRLGFRLLENVSGKELGGRYFSGNGDPGFRPPASSYLAHLTRERA